MKLRAFTMAFLILCVLLCSQGYSTVIGQTGQCWSITEPDAYEELMSKVKQHNWQKEFARLKAKSISLTRVNFQLKKAKQDRTFEVDPTYTLPFDVVDSNGNVVYPKGYRFNPLHYMQFPYILYFIDANSVEELTWLKKQDIANWNVVIIATKGDTLKAEKFLGKTVYGASKLMIERFKIKATPSKVYAQNGVIVVNEVGVYK